MKAKDAISNADLFLYALYRLGGAGSYVDVEDIYMEMWELAPARFKWRKYDVPNYKIMAKALVDISQRGDSKLLLGSSDVRQLSAKGVEWIEARLPGLNALATGKISAPPDRRPGQRIVAELAKQPLVREFIGGLKPTLDRLTVARLLRCAPDSPRRVWRERLETLRSGAQDGDRADLLNFLRYVENERREWFHHEN